jgi:hypothetical protein
MDSMNPRNLDLAAEFCSLVGAPDLLSYLGVEADADEASARSKLKKRRKYMQGMQGNPKYKQEALFLIKHFAALNEVLGDLPAYRAEARRRSESEHLPVLEMTVRGVLAGGGLTEEQEEFLRHNAIALGVSERTYEEILRRLAKEAGVPLVGGLPTPPPVPERGEARDLYQLLRIPPSASPSEVAEAYQQRRTEAEVSGKASPELIRKLDIAKKVLTNAAARQQYDLTAARTGPPARTREVVPPSGPQYAATAPPVRRRGSHDPESLPPGQRSLSSRLEVLGEPVRSVSVGGGPHTAEPIRLRNGGSGPMMGKVSADVPWVELSPTTLDPDAEEQQIEVTIDGSAVPEAAVSTAVVTIVTEKGERARVVLEVQRSSRGPLIIGAIVVAVLLAAAAVGLALQLS